MYTLFLKLTTVRRVGNSPRLLWSDFVRDRVCYGPNYPVTVYSFGFHAVKKDGGSRQVQRVCWFGDGIVERSKYCFQQMGKS